MVMKLSLDTFKPVLSLDERRINVDPETRRIAVRIASWNDVHSGFNQAVRMPRDVNVEAAHVGAATLEDGSTIRVSTLPMHTMHAPKNLDAMHAASWYEDSGTGVARVRYSTDEHGLRADGVLFSDVDESTLERLTAAAPSGDWRSAVAVRRPEDFEHSPADLVGACIVNIPGFSDTYAKAPGKRYALAASAYSIISFEEGSVVAEERVNENTITTTLENVVTAAAYDKPAECVGKCKGCECSDEERAAMSAASDDEADEDAALTAAALLIVERASKDEVEPAELISTLQANAVMGYPDHDHVHGIHPTDRRMELIEQRLYELEQLVAESVMSM